MRDVKLVRLSDDGTHLVLTHEGTGEEFALRVDDRLRGAVVSDRARQGSLPLERQSRLRPKEIQARLRAGESSEDIAAAADVPIERILRYAGPVLAEREYIAEQARRCALRRHGRDGPGQILDEAVGKRLDELRVEREMARWDAWRSSEGRWVIAVSFSLGGTEHQATFGYDPLGRLVTTSDDKARALVGEAAQPVPGLTPELAPGFVNAPADAGGQGSTSGRAVRDGRLRLAPVPPPEPEPEPDLDVDVDVDSGSGARSAGRGFAESEETVDLSATLGAPLAAPALGAQQRRTDSAPASPAARDDELDPDEVADLDDPVPAEQSARQRPDTAPSTKPSTQQRGRSSADARRRRARSAGRRGSVPSWDDILFGGGRGGSQD